MKKSSTIVFYYKTGPSVSQIFETGKRYTGSPSLEMDFPMRYTKKDYAGSLSSNGLSLAGGCLWPETRNTTWFYHQKEYTK